MVSRSKSIVIRLLAAVFVFAAGAAAVALLLSDDVLALESAQQIPSRTGPAAVESSTAQTTPKLGPGLRIALHAQSRHSEHGWVAGSEITTAGIMRALRRIPQVDFVRVFATFSYAGLREDGPWDLAIIEGHSGSVPAFIRQIRSINPSARIIHYCLDTYPSLDQIMRLDVDAYFTNSKVLLPELEKIAPSAYFPLAVDPEVMHPGAADKASFDHKVVYVGHNSPGKKHLIRMLTEAAPFGLAIYGHPGWKKAPHALRKLYRGVLPPDDLPALYASASVVIGTTELKQQRLGMINNRLYEALSAGAVLISDTFDAVEQEFSSENLVLFDRGRPGDTAAHLSRLLGIEAGSGDNRVARAELERRSTAGRQRIIKNETWDHRVAGMIHFVDKLPLPSVFPRPNRPRALMIGEGVSRFFSYPSGSKSLLFEVLEKNNAGGNALPRNEAASGLHEHFRVDMEERWEDLFAVALESGNPKSSTVSQAFCDLLDLFDVIVVALMPFGDDDTSFRSLRLPLEKDNGPDGVDDLGYHFYPFRDSNGWRARKILLPPSFFSKEDGLDGDFSYESFEKYYNARDSRSAESSLVPIHHFYDDVLIKPPSLPATMKAFFELASSMLNVLYRPRRSSRISILSPINGTLVPLTQERVKIQVAFFDYKSPADGMWCVTVQGKETNCAGDSSTQLVVPLPVNDAAAKYPEKIEIRIVLRDHFRNLHHEYEQEPHHYDDKIKASAPFGGGHLRRKEEPLILLRQQAPAENAADVNTDEEQENYNDILNEVIEEESEEKSNAFNNTDGVDGPRSRRTKISIEVDGISKDLYLSADEDLLAKAIHFCLENGILSPTDKCAKRIASKAETQLHEEAESDGHFCRRYHLMLATRAEDVAAVNGFSRSGSGDRTSSDILRAGDCWTLVSITGGGETGLSRRIFKKATSRLRKQMEFLPSNLLTSKANSESTSIHSKVFRENFNKEGEETNVVLSPPRLTAMQWLYFDCLTCTPFMVWSPNKDTQKMMFMSKFSTEFLNLLISQDWDRIILLPSSANARAEAEKQDEIPQQLPDLQYSALRAQLLKTAQRSRLRFWKLNSEELRRSQEQTAAWQEEEFKEHSDSCSYGQGQTKSKHSSKSSDEEFSQKKDRSGRKSLPTVGIVYYRPQSTPKDSFEVGFFSAVQKLSNMGLYHEIRKFNIANLEGLDRDSPELKQLLSEFDLGANGVLLVKSNWGWVVDEFAREFLGHIETPKLLLISGTAPVPKDSSIVRFYDGLVYETLWYYQTARLSEHHPNTHHAFGIDTSIMTSQNQKGKIWDLLFVGWMAPYKRLEKFVARFQNMKRQYDESLKSNPVRSRYMSAPRALAIGKLDATEQSAAIVKQLKEAGVVVRPEVSYQQLASIMQTTREIYIPSNIYGGGERAVLEARACGVKVSVENDNPKLQDLADENTPIYDHNYYANQLAKAIFSVVKK